MKISAHLWMDGIHHDYVHELPIAVDPPTHLLLAKGLLFGWALFDNESWSLWVDDRCVEAHGEHERFKHVLEEDVDWSDSGNVEHAGPEDEEDRT